MQDFRPADASEWISPVEPTPKQQGNVQMALALTRKLGNRIYNGSVRGKEKARRRAAGKAAKRARKINRKGN